MSSSVTSAVVDASAIVRAVLAGSLRDLVADRSLHAPHLIDIEVLHALRRLTLSRLIDEVRAFEALQDFADLPIDRFPHDALTTRIWGLRANFTAYDAAYLALAELLAVPLVTCDARLARAASRFIEVEVVE